MTQRDLNRAVARATGETIQEINRRGFVPLADGPAEPERPYRLDESQPLERQHVGTPTLMQQASAMLF